MTVALAVRKIAPTLLAEARAACSALGLVVEDWVGGIPRNVPQIVITSIDAGDRYLPEEICALLEASPGVRAVICANEPLIKPRIVLAGGRVVLLAPPVDRFRLTTVLRGALGEEPPIRPDHTPAARFELLRRQYWVAWSRGTEAPPIMLDERCGLTVALGPMERLGEVVRIVNEETNDARLEAILVSTLGTDGAVVRLTEDIVDWLIYWPLPDRPLWICSHHRIPARWDASPAFSAGGARRLIRLSAFPGDQIVAGWAAALPPPKMFSPLDDIVLEGGSETLQVLTSITHQVPSVDGVVVEVR